MTSDVYVEEEKFKGTDIWLYTVWADGKIYDSMTTSSSLSWSDQLDMAKSYKQALDNYNP